MTSSVYSSYVSSPWQGRVQYNLDRHEDNVLYNGTDAKPGSFESIWGMPRSPGQAPVQAAAVSSGTSTHTPLPTQTYPTFPTITQAPLLYLAFLALGLAILYRLVRLAGV